MTHPGNGLKNPEPLNWATEETNHPREVVEAAYAPSDLFERRRRLMDDWAAYLDGR